MMASLNTISIFQVIVQLNYFLHNQVLWLSRRVIDSFDQVEATLGELLGLFVCMVIHTAWCRAFAWGCLGACCCWFWLAMRHGRLFMDQTYCAVIHQIHVGGLIASSHTVKL